MEYGILQFNHNEVEASDVNLVLGDTLKKLGYQISGLHVIKDYSGTVGAKRTSRNILVLVKPSDSDAARIPLEDLLHPIKQFGEAPVFEALRKNRSSHEYSKLTHNLTVVGLYADEEVCNKVYNSLIDSETEMRAAKVATYPLANLMDALAKFANVLKE